MFGEILLFGEWLHSYATSEETEMAPFFGWISVATSEELLIDHFQKISYSHLSFTLDLSMLFANDMIFDVRLSLILSMGYMIIYGTCEQNLLVCTYL